MRFKQSHPIFIYLLTIFGLGGGYYFVFSEFSNFFGYMRLEYPDFEISTVAIPILSCIVALTIFAIYLFIRDEPEFQTIPEKRSAPTWMNFIFIAVLLISPFVQKIPYEFFAQKNGYKICKEVAKRSPPSLRSSGGPFFDLTFCKPD